MNNIVTESTYDEEWYQPELTCSECGCVFMYSHSGRPKHPAYCPACGIKFKYLKRDDHQIYPIQ